MINGVMIRQFLKQERRSRTWLAAQVDISVSLLEKMLSGHVPKDETLEALAKLMGVTPQSLLAKPKKEARTA